MYIFKPPAAVYIPPFYTPPTPRRVFSGVGGGCIKVGPPTLSICWPGGFCRRMPRGKVDRNFPLNLSGSTEIPQADRRREFTWTSIATAARSVNCSLGDKRAVS